MNGRAWSDEDRETVRRLYATTRTTDLAAQLGRTPGQVYNIANKLGVHKTPEYLNDPANCARITKGRRPAGGELFQFKPGQMPHNKGLRRPGWSVGRMAETQFKRGERTGIAAKNYRPIGTILADHEGYLRIKVRDSVHGKEPTGFGNVKVWPLLQRHVWAQHHGPIPAGMAVCFRDGDRTNCNIENLELVTRAELARRNNMWATYPRELAEVIHLAGVLKRRIRSTSSGKEHD